MKSIQQQSFKIKNAKTSFLTIDFCVCCCNPVHYKMNKKGLPCEQSLDFGYLPISFFRRILYDFTLRSVKTFTIHPIYIVTMYSIELILLKKGDCDCCLGGGNCVDGDVKVQRLSIVAGVACLNLAEHVTCLPQVVVKSITI